MKKYIIIGAIFAILVCSLVTTSILMNRYRKIAERNEDNYTAVVQNRALQQKLTVSEFKEYYPELAKTAKEYGIKPKNLEHVIEAKYSYKDTLIAKDTLIYVYDTVKQDFKADFRYTDSCFTVAGTVYKNGYIEITDKGCQDNITTMLFKTRKCIFKKWKYKAVVVSKCTGDTLEVKNNIKIVKSKTD